MRFISACYLMLVACASVRPVPMVEIGRSTGGIAPLIFAFRVDANGRAQLDLFSRTVEGTVPPEYATAFIAAARERRIWEELKIARDASAADENAEPGSLWLKLGRHEVSFVPTITTAVGKGQEARSVYQANVPKTFLALLQDAQKLCRSAIAECKYYELVPP